MDVASGRDAEFMELECPLTVKQEATYNEAVSFWKVCCVDCLVLFMDATTLISPVHRVRLGAIVTRVRPLSRTSG